MRIELGEREHFARNSRHSAGVLHKMFRQNAETSEQNARATP
jgi:hypothetical protein